MSITMHMCFTRLIVSNKEGSSRLVDWFSSIGASLVDLTN